MTKIALASSVVFTLLATAAPSRAQEVTRMPETSRHAVGLEGGLDGAFVARASYTQRVDLGVMRDERLYAGFTMPFFAPDVGNWALDGGLRATPFALGDFRLALALGPVVRSTSNALYSATAAGAGATLLLGHEGPRWGLSAELDYEQMFVAYVRQSDLYRDTFYAGARDGLYTMPGSTAHAGLRGGLRFGSVEIAARLGYEATGRLNAAVPPYYGTLGVSYAF